TTAGVQYAIAYALYMARGNSIAAGDVAEALARVNFDRPRHDPKAPRPSEQNPITQAESPFAGNLIDPYTGKVGSGRPAWEAAGEALFKMVQGKQKVQAA